METSALSPAAAVSQSSPDENENRPKRVFQLLSELVSRIPVDSSAEPEVISDW
jgi:hypothetical protein